MLIPTFSVSMEISDLFYLSYLVPSSRVASYVPKPLTPSLFVEDKVFLSVVCFHSRNVKVAGLPLVKFSYDQINVRTYVRDPFSGRKGVLFLFSGINSSFISLATNIFGFPWKNISFVLKTTRNKIDQPHEIHAKGKWNGDIDIKLAEAPVSAISEGFRDTSEYITSPNLGFYNIRGSALGFRVSHTKVRPRTGKMLQASFPFLVSSGLITESRIAEPDNILLADEAKFTIFLPPHKTTARKDN
jgi:hypothetical protein